MIILREIIPYEKDIKFDTKISEITSISLEHEENINEGELEGYFIVSGDYKIHQISVNKEEFKYKIPYSIELTDSIIKNSITIDINDFTYDIKDNDTLNVKIELEFNYDVKEEEVREATVIDESLDQELMDLIEEEENNEKKEIKEEKEKVNVVDENKDNTYVTYHVYIVSKEDSIESICLKYNVDKDTLHEYNDFDEINVGDKLLIPIIDE